MTLSSTSLRLAWAACLGAGLLVPCAAHGQDVVVPPTAPGMTAAPAPLSPPPMDMGSAAACTEGPSCCSCPCHDGTNYSTAVDFIDSAVPMTQIHERYDDMNGINRPTRAEFLFTKPLSLGGMGPEFSASSVKIQELSTYFEYAVCDSFSMFLNAPVEFVRTTPGAPDHAGYSDMDVGVKFAVYRDEHTVGTFQVRVYAPSGDASLALGNKHVSIEPAFLGYLRLPGQFNLEGELRYWAPVSGTEFAGDILRYGVGLSWGTRDAHGFWAMPVAEIVGWTVTSGQQVVDVNDDVNGASDTIVNGCLGVRAGYGCRTEVYFGYGRALTGDVWYKNDYRAEFRINF